MSSNECIGGVVGIIVGCVVAGLLGPIFEEETSRILVGMACGVVFTLAGIRAGGVRE